MICFPDTNAVIKLAAFDLLQEAFQAVGVLPDEVKILRETRQICRGNTLKVQYGRPAIARIEAFLRHTGGVAFVIDPEEHVRLTYTDGIDDGEAILFAATRGHEDFRVITDDKNSLRALAEEPECRDVFDRLAGRVLCLEQILLMLMPRYEYENFRLKLMLSPHSIRALQQTLGMDSAAPPSHVEQALRAAVDLLNRETNYILCAP